MALDDKTKQQIIDLYRQGKRTADITEATGAPRSTIYYLLQQEGITPRRRGGPRTTERPPLDADDAQKLEWAIARITELDQEIDRMKRCITAAADCMQGREGASAH
jgi:hypothetical protein